MVNPPEYDEDLKKLQELPEKWSENSKKITLTMIVSREQAAWVAKKIFDTVDKSQLSAILNAKHSSNSVELVINLNVDAAPIIGSLSFLLFEIKTRLITDYLRRTNKKREKKNYNL